MFALEKFESAEDYVKTFMSENFRAIVPTTVASDFLGIYNTRIHQLCSDGRLQMIIVKCRGRVSRGVTLSSIIQYYDSVEKDKDAMFDHLTQEVKGILESRAERKRTIWYSELMEQVGMNSKNPRDRAQIGAILDKISRDSWEEDEKMLSALVVLKSTSLPSDNFFILAKEFVQALEDEDDEREFHETQLSEIYDYYS